MKTVHVYTGWRVTRVDHMPVNFGPTAVAELSSYKRQGILYAMQGRDDAQPPVIERTESYVECALTREDKFRRDFCGHCLGGWERIDVPDDTIMGVRVVGTGWHASL